MIYICLGVHQSEYFSKAVKMNTSDSDAGQIENSFLINFENDLKDWLCEDCERTELNYLINNIAVTICLIKSYDIFPKKSLLTRPLRIPNQVRVVPDNKSVQNIFFGIFKPNPKNKKFFIHKEIAEKNKFDLHFYATRRELIDDEAITKDRHAKYRQQSLPLCFPF